MPDVSDAILDRKIRTIVDEVDPEQVILFGSRARGDARPDSDIDLLIIESERFGDGRSSHAEEVRIGRALPATPVARDILVYSRDEIERWRGSLNHVAARALREGRVMYSRDWGAPSIASRPCSVRDGEPQPDVDQARLLLDMAEGDIRFSTRPPTRPRSRTRTSDSTSSKPPRSASRPGLRCSATSIR